MNVLRLCPECSPEGHPWHVDTKEEADALFKHQAERHVVDLAAGSVSSLVTFGHGPTEKPWKAPDWYPSWMHGFERERWEKTLYEHRHETVRISRIRRPGSSHMVRVGGWQVMFPTEARQMARALLKAIKGWRDFDEPPYTVRGTLG